MKDLGKPPKSLRYLLLGKEVIICSVFICIKYLLPLIWMDVSLIFCPYLLVIQYRKHFDVINIFGFTDFNFAKYIEFRRSITSDVVTIFFGSQGYNLMWLCPPPNLSILLALKELKRSFEFRDYCRKSLYLAPKL